MDITASPASMRKPKVLRSGRKAASMHTLSRAHMLEAMEPRYMMAADPIRIGGVYIEEDFGSDLHGDSFYITFQGGAAGTLLTRLTIDGDLNSPGFGLGDLFFDTEDSGYGADHSFAFHVEELHTANPSATVTATVRDGETKLILNFTNFVAGDSLKFSIDVDEVQSFDPNEQDVNRQNENFDPITSGVEFQNSLFKAEFAAPHYEAAIGQDHFLNRYDPRLDPLGLALPKDDADGKRDRSAGAGFEVQQVPKPISLAGTVYVDSNEDFALQASEQRLSGVQVELFRLENGNYVSTGHSTSTDSQGRYSFGANLGLQPGTFQIRETQPSGYYSVGASPGRLNGSPIGQTVAGNPDMLTQVALLLGDQHATDLNFGENLPASLSGHVCVVISGFDCFSSSSEKASLANVLVELRDASGAVVSTQRTGQDGSYAFTNLRAGIYSITEVTPTNLLDGDAKVGSVGGTRLDPNRLTQITIGGGVNAVDYDFCELTPSDLSGHTYFDQNNNGVRDPSETPLVNVLVTLWDDAGAKVGETRTDVNGYYQFDRLRPGNYSVTEQTPAGYTPGRAAVGTIRGSAVGQSDTSGDVINSLVLPAGSQGINYDFGEILTGSIAGRVIADSNGNCLIDALGEMPLAGVSIELLDGSGSVLRTTLTDSSGYYLFDDLMPGSYSVREIQPVGYFHGDQNAGSGGGDDSFVDLIRLIEVNPGADLVDYDFCDVPPSSIAGSVFVDSNQDCYFDSGEAPIAGVSVTLLDASDAVVATTQTDASGNYRFVGLRAGHYTVRELQPVGYFHGGQRAGSGGGVDTVQDVVSAIDLLAGTDLVDYDFCEVLPGSIAGIVFADLDFNCIQDANEVSLAGVRVELLDANGTVMASTLTDSQGRYSFGNLKPANYRVREIQPVGYFHGGQVAPASGGDDSLDDIISSLILASGQMIVGANFCEVPPAKIAGFVFQDGSVIVTETGDLPENIRELRDGQRTEDDTPIQGVRLQLRTLTGLTIESTRALPGYYTDTIIAVQTDASGYFQFDGLRAGAYHVYETHPDGFVDSLDTPGTTTGFAINPGDTVPEFILSLIQLSNPGSNPGSDAILLISVEPGQTSNENNFSEVIAQALPPTPPQAPPPQAPPPPLPPAPPPKVIPPAPPSYGLPAPLLGNSLPWEPLPLLVGVGHDAPLTWHLSIINGGFPRGARSGERIDEVRIANSANRLNVYAWTVRGLKDSTWHIVSTHPGPAHASQRIVFDLPGAKPLTGDFNGDGFDELALFIDGEWFIDLNGNGRWDESDIWLKLGARGDQSVVGDWDGDGKDDVGIFGQEWPGDDRALESEHGIPDSENLRRIKPKNVPPTADEAPDDPRLLARSQKGPARADLIDHVFRFGGGNDIAIAGDFNGDGVSTLGIFDEGRWILDVDGDGILSEEFDRQEIFGRPGDLPLVGDFDGDGIDELAIVRGNQVIVDSNSNGHIDATDQVFLLDSDDGTVIAGDFDGDGRDEPALHQSAETRRTLEARRAE